MPARISLFTSVRQWWSRGPAADEAITDTAERAVDFRAGRAVLLSAGDGAVTGLARGGRRRSASDFEHGVRFDRIHRCDPVSFDDLLSAVRPASRGAAARVFDGGYGLFTEAASSDIRNYLDNDVLEEILATEPAWMSESPEAAAQYRMERDAVNVMLEIAGFDRELSLEGETLPTASEHFLAEPEARSNEDSIVIDDLDVFPGWERVRSLRPGGRVFEDLASGRRLTVLHANKNPLEQTTGVDLLYFVHDYRAFVLVQYKRVRREGERKILRLDAQLDAEYERMLEIELGFRPQARAESLAAHRLADTVCFFKLCETEQPAEVSDLSRGKYVDLRAWELMAAHQMKTGPKGGRYLEYTDVARYLTNSMFAELVSEGWIGSVPDQFDLVLDYLFQRYQAGVSVILGSLRMGATLRRIPGASQQLRVKVVLGLGTSDT